MQHPLFKVSKVFYSIWKTAHLNKLMEEKALEKESRDNSSIQIAALPKEHLHTNPSSRQVLHNKQITNKRIPIVFEILFWLLQCKSVFSSTNKRAQTPCSCVLLCKHQSCGHASSVPWILSLICISLSTCHLLHLTGTDKCIFRAWHCRMSLGTFGSMAHYQVHFLKHVNVLWLIAFFRCLIYKFH